MLYLTLLLISTAVATPLLGTEQCARGPPYWCQNVKTASICGAVSHCQQNVWNKPHVQSVGCDLCKEVVTVIGQLLKDNATQAEILDYLEKTCQLLPEPSLRSECKQMVDTYYPVLIGIITGELDDPGAACAAVGLCQSVQKAMVASQLVSNEIPQVDLSQIVSPFLANVPQLLYPQETPKQAPKNGDLCKDCVQFITDFQDEAKANTSYIDHLVAEIEKQCDKLGPGMSDMCKQYVGQYAPLVFMQLMSMQPKDLCCRAGFCASVHSVPMETLVAAEVTPAKLFPALKLEETSQVKPLALKPAKKMVRVRESPECVLCEFIMKQLETMLEDQRTEKAVIDAVEKVCSLLPSTLSAQCKDMIDAYGKAIIELLVQQTDPKTVCSFLGLCKGESRTYIPEIDTARFKAGGFCDVCKMAVRYIDGILENNATEAEIEEAVKKVCNYLPDAYKQECDQLIEQYEPTLVQLLLQMMDPDFVCTKVGACPGAAGKLLGTEQCSWGPAFWCKNMDTALRCNAVEHCKRHIWI